MIQELHNDKMLSHTSSEVSLSVIIYTVEYHQSQDALVFISS